MSEAVSAYDCSVACLNTANCGSSIFVELRCYMNMQSQSACSQQNLAFEIHFRGLNTRGYAANNGYCGSTGRRL